MGDEELPAYRGEHADGRRDRDENGVPVGRGELAGEVGDEQAEEEHRPDEGGRGRDEDGDDAGPSPSPSPSDDPSEGPDGGGGGGGADGDRKDDKGSLPLTGGALTGLIIAALVAVGAGGGALYLSRKRATTPDAGEIDA